ncbi:MAG TPA: GreA/GreB family elongation factor [Alphaproteobacteria bacterium]|nr:GreA/GreB family elongation factor [Alphaproteobacteria bacterium]
MSRAFVKEDAGPGAGDDQPDRPLSPHPNYVTPRGHRQLADRLASLRREREGLLEDDLDDQLAWAQLAREIRYLEARLDSALPVDPAMQPVDEIAFGAAVEVEDGNERRRTVTIVGEDEADPSAGFISYVSPLARALIGAKVGDVVTWSRPAGDEELEVVSIRYG